MMVTCPGPQEESLTAGEQNWRKKRTETRWFKANVAKTKLPEPIHRDSADWHQCSVTTQIFTIKKRKKVMKSGSVQTCICLTLHPFQCHS